MTTVFNSLLECLTSPAPVDPFWILEQNNVHSNICNILPYWSTSLISWIEFCTPTMICEEIMLYKISTVLFLYNWSLQIKLSILVIFILVVCMPWRSGGRRQQQLRRQWNLFHQILLFQISILPSIKHLLLSNRIL